MREKALSPMVVDIGGAVAANSKSTMAATSAAVDEGAAGPFGIAAGFQK